MCGGLQWMEANGGEALASDAYSGESVSTGPMRRHASAASAPTTVPPMEATAPNAQSAQRSAR